MASPSLVHLFGSVSVLHQMNSDNNVGCSRWSWNEDSVHPCHRIVSNETSSFFLTYCTLTEHIKYVIFFMLDRMS
jgi:hypothetical protein